MYSLLVVLKRPFTVWTVERIDTNRPAAAAVSGPPEPEYLLVSCAYEENQNQNETRSRLRAGRHILSFTVGGFLSNVNENNILYVYILYLPRPDL
jgi:hypothetical protein